MARRGIECAWLAVGCLALPLLGPRVASAQAGRIEIAASSSLSPVGAGARAVGIGSAFIAVADDATAASWNPAGLVQLERPELSVVGSAAIQSIAGGALDASDETVERQIQNDGGDAASIRLNHLSAALPGRWRGRNAIVSLNYQQVLAFEYDFEDHLDERTNFGDEVHRDRHLEQDGAVYTVSPALAAELWPSLSFGAALNIWLDGIGRPYAWRVSSAQSSVGVSGTVTTRMDGVESVEFDRFRGVNATFGALWKPVESLSLGVVGKIPFHASFRRTVRLETNIEREPGLDSAESSSASAKVGLRYPLSIGGGFAVRPSDDWLIAVDATWVDWGYFRVYDSDRSGFLITADPAGSAMVESVTTVRAGVERTTESWGALLAFRAGGSYDPEPSRGAPDEAFTANAGLGVTLEPLSIDAAYEWRYVPSSSGTSLVRNLLRAEDESVAVQRHTVYLSLIYYLSI